MSTDRDTVRSYDATAAEYAAEAAAMPEWVGTEIDAFVTDLGGSGKVLEIGSGGGRDALEFEKRGISVRRTDVSMGFVELLRGNGFEADLLDPLTDDLTDPQRSGTPYDGGWACACLIHVAREDFRTVLGRLASATRIGGRLHASVREGDGEEVSESGSRSLAGLLVAMSRRTGASPLCGPHSQVPAGQSARYVDASKGQMIGG
jgi:SAM-dependent methyltransferase